jgi:hypothetical protein
MCREGGGGVFTSLRCIPRDAICRNQTLLRCTSVSSAGELPPCTFRVMWLVKWCYASGLSNWRPMVFSNITNRPEDKAWAIYLTHRNRPPDSLLTLNGRNFPFVNSVKYLGVIVGKRMTWRLHTEMIESKAFRTFIRIYSLFKSKRLSANIKLTLHKALIRSVITYACPGREFEAECHPLKLQRLQNKVLRTIGSFLSRASVRDMHVAFQIPYVYDYIQI